MAFLMAEILLFANETLCTINISILKYEFEIWIESLTRDGISCRIIAQKENFQLERNTFNAFNAFARILIQIV